MPGLRSAIVRAGPAGLTLAGAVAGLVAAVAWRFSWPRQFISIFFWLAALALAIVTRCSMRTWLVLVGVVLSLQIWGASAATARVRPGQSEVVRVPTMGMFDPAAMLQTPVLKNCPHLRKNLVPFPTGTVDVVIPSGSSILLRASDLQQQQQQQQQQQVNYRRITVSPNATLIFNDEPMTLHVEEIFVARGGALLLGSETCRLASAIQIVYHGAANSSSLENDYSPGGKTSKGLVSFGGHVEMHGQLFHPTWTRLAATAAAGDTVIHLQDWVNWQVGQQILLTTTIFQDCPDKFLKNAAWCPQKLPSTGSKCGSSASRRFASWPTARAAPCSRSARASPTTTSKTSRRAISSTERRCTPP